jgi:pimeloyl-ACP methyl ester carboxylesterase
MLGNAAGAVDRAVVAALHARGARDRARAEKMTHAERLEALALIHRSYDTEALVAAPERFFPVPPAIDPTVREPRRGVWDLEWPSTFTPYLPAVAERYLANVQNRTAYARAFFGGAAPTPREPTTRPAVIALHGYMGGHWLLEEATWPIPWLLRRGLDVVLPVLPLHARRGGTRRGAPPFPSADPRLTNEGFRQAVADVVALARWLRARGAPHVGVIGVSLGGYTSALVATVSRAADPASPGGARPRRIADIDFVMPMIPLASIADFAREQGRLGVGALADEQHAALERANWIVSPLARPLALPASRALVVAAAHDRITPAAHAARIANHFACELVTIPGGHLLQLGRAEAFRALTAMLAREGIIADRRRRRTT